MRSLALLLALLAPIAMAAKVEEPRWQLLEQVGEVEIRRYDPVVQARTPLNHSGQTNRGFQRLAGYIFGGNASGQQIAMTAPVEETLQANAPVMAFTMPAEYGIDSLPLPKDGSVTLVAVPARTVAAIRFSGWATAGKIERHTEQLLATLSEAGINVVGPASLNQYNPPWTPPFMRRNEIMVQVEDRAELAQVRHF